MLGYLSLDIICSSSLTVFLELRSRETVRISEQITSADKYPSIMSRQMATIVYIFPSFQYFRVLQKIFEGQQTQQPPSGVKIQCMIRHLALGITCCYAPGKRFAFRTRLHVCP